MDKYAVFGHPIKQSMSPNIHRQFAEQTGQTIQYEALDPGLDNFEQAISDFIKAGGKGCNVTMPFKERAFDISNEISERAKLAGAVNTLTFNSDGRISADNTDGAGLVADLKSNGAHIRGRILLIGAGGAARGVIKSLLDCQPEELVIVNRTHDKAKLLADRFKGFGSIRACEIESVEGLPAFDVVINSTSTSLTGDLPPVHKNIFGDKSFAYDMVYAGAPTSFLRWAKDNGCIKIVDGLGMLVGQAAESFNVWRKIVPERQSILENIRTKLTSG